MKYLGYICLSIGLMLSSQAVAQQLHMTSEDWKVFTIKKGNETMCYIASVPVKKTGNYTRRGEPFVLVTHRKASVDEVSVSSGYPYKDNQETVLSVDGKRYNLFVKGERGWAYDEKQDNAIVGSMIKGSEMVVKGVSQKGTTSTDTYSLKGFTKAHQKMKALCR